MRRIAANGTEIAYRVDGPEGAPVVLLSHCLTGDSRVWEPQIAGLRERFRLISYDLRGHGQSAATAPPYTIEMLADDAVALLDALAIERAHFVGLSIGGMIGQAVAATRPERVRSLMLCACAARVPPPSMWDERMALVGREGLAPLIPGTLERWFSDAFRAAQPDAVARIAAIIRETPVDAFIGGASAVRDADLREQAAGIAVPTLILYGSDDGGIAPALAVEMHDLIRGSRFEVLPGLRHHPNLEGAETVNARIAAFMDAG